jgi:type IV pilus assembly protein PilQ
MNKANFFLIIIISLSLIGCASKDNPGNSGKIKKEIDVVSIKRDGLTKTNSTFKDGPSIGYNNSLKPRREISSSAESINSPIFPISINFDNTDLREALIGLGNLAKKTIVVDDNVNGVLNYSVKNQPWHIVINSIIEIKGLSYSINKDLDIIKITDVSSDDNIQITEIFNIYYETPSVLKSQLETILAGENVQEGATSLTIVENDQNKTLIVKATESQINEIEKILNKIDIKKPQVLIEAFLVEVSPTFASKLGTRLGVTRTYTGSDGATNTIRGGVGTAGSDVALGDDVASATNFLVSGTSGLGIIRSTTSGELKFEIDALETEGDSKTLSNPKLFTISGKNAIIKQGTQVGINETTTTDGGTIQTSVKYYDANLLLDVTPIITGDGSVMMEVKINNDSFDLSVSPPKITKKEISTNLILVDGDIAVVGGILTETLSENNSRVPVLGKMPGVGTLFRSRAQVDDRQELLIFLAPRII